MTTKFLDNKIRTFKILFSWRFPRKTAFQCSPPSKTKILFYCRLAVSERKFPKYFWEKRGIFLEGLGGSQRQLCIKTRPLLRTCSAQRLRFKKGGPSPLHSRVVKFSLEFGKLRCCRVHLVVLSSGKFCKRVRPSKLHAQLR